MGTSKKKTGGGSRGVKLPYTRGASEKTEGQQAQVGHETGHDKRTMATKPVTLRKRGKKPPQNRETGGESRTYRVANGPKTEVGREGVWTRPPEIF